MQTSKFLFVLTNYGSYPDLQVKFACTLTIIVMPRQSAHAFNSALYKLSDLKILYRQCKELDDNNLAFKGMPSPRHIHAYFSKQEFSLFKTSFISTLQETIHQ